MGETVNNGADGKIGCAICGARVHIIKSHLEADHADISLQVYEENHPGAPLMSDKAIKVTAERAAAKLAATIAAPVPSIKGDNNIMNFDTRTEPMHTLFKLGRAKAAMGHRGNEIPITVMKAPDSLRDYVPGIDPNYIFPIDLLKVGLLGLEMGTPSYLWGHAGTGKSTMWEQICAYTGRPTLRVQHTRDTESSHVVGQWTVKDGHTVFELGPLAYCMKHGLTYLADEYDFGMPAILALYQPVLEGKPLVIKEADELNRIIKPHPMFRFVATGNTNGTGDETGLYQGTMMQNAANYERFGIVEEVHYMDNKIEVGILMGQGQVSEDDAKKMVSFGTVIREAFGNGKIGLPVSPRALINACKSGRRLGSLKRGLELSYINRLGRVDQEAAREVMNRFAF